MAYGRRFSRSVRALMIAATLCDYWPIALAAVLVASPVQPRLHFGTAGENCVYLGRTGFTARDLAEDQGHCPILRFHPAR